MTVSGHQLEQDVLDARTPDSIVGSLARLIWAAAHNGDKCPASYQPTATRLSNWFQRGQGRLECRNEASELLSDFFGTPAVWLLKSGVDGLWAFRLVLPAPVRVSDGEAEHGADDCPRYVGAEIAGKWFAENAEPFLAQINGERRARYEALPWDKVHEDWVSRRLESDARSVHPIAPIVRGWQKRPSLFSECTVKTTQAMTRRKTIVSDVRRVAWVNDISLDAAHADGQPMATRITDLGHAFGLSNTDEVVRRVYKPSEQMPLKLKGLGQLHTDWRLTALVCMGNGRSPVLASDVLVLMTVAHAVGKPVVLTEREGASLLARTRTGAFRRPVPGDFARFWNAAAALNCLALRDPRRSWRWGNLALVQADPVQRTVTLGPPTWLRNFREEGGRWTLTAEGSSAGKARIIAGGSGVAARLVTGIEYRLAASFDGRLGIAPDLRPARGRGGAGRVVRLPWHYALQLAGDGWDNTDQGATKAALQRYRRAVDRLIDKAGYLTPSPGEAARAGDSVEIVNVVRGGRSHEPALDVRASARFVEAAKQASSKQGGGMERVSLRTWLGMDAGVVTMS